MKDYLAWDSAGGVKEGVAWSAGVWDIGHFIDTKKIPGPYVFMGDGSSIGSKFWISEGSRDIIRSNSRVTL